MKLLLSITICLFMSSAWALNLKEARSKGLVKELKSGFIQATNKIASSLAKDINSRRKQHYLKISKETGTSYRTVGQIAAKKIQKKLSH